MFGITFAEATKHIFCKIVEGHCDFDISTIRPKIR